ncbi:MAG: LLM class flavin-dependent oxidoreductase [Pseudonocardia sp.]
MRHGLLFIGAGATLSEMVEVARAAEDGGWDSVAMVEAYRSAAVPLAALALGTSRIGIGSFIMNAYGRSPFLTGLTAIDLDEVTGGRLTLGIGSGNRHINEEFQGTAKARPLRKLTEYVEIVQRMTRVPEAGAEVVYDGEVHSIRWTAMNKPVRPSIPVVLAAVFPGMVKAAATVADGVGLGVLLSPEYIREVIRPAALAAAGEAGRDPGVLTFPMAALTAVDEDEEYARNLVRRTICSFFHPIPHSYYDYLLREQGYSKVADACSRYAPIGQPERAMEAMDDELVDRLAFSGTPETVHKRVAQYADVIDEALYLNVSAPRDDGADSAGVAPFRQLLRVPSLSGT